MHKDSTFTGPLLVPMPILLLVWSQQSSMPPEPQPTPPEPQPTVTLDQTLETEHEADDLLPMFGLPA